MEKIPTFVEFSDRNGKNEITVSAMDYVSGNKSDGQERIIMLPDLNIREKDLLKYLKDRYSLDIIGSEV